MFSKIGNLLSSIRFWQITLAAGTYGVANPDKIAETVVGWLVAIAAIGTVDKAAANAKGGIE